MNRRELESSLRHRTARDPVARAVRDVARETGSEIWLVGGYVRDAALARPSDDLDWIGGRGTTRLVRALARHWRRRAFRFRKRGVTTWRLSIEDRQVDLVDASRRGLDADLARRDFTINAIAFDPLAGRILDPLRGLADLRSGRLRLPRAGVVGEDPLRALRAARFLAQLPRFRLAAAARDEVVRVAPRLRRAAVERVRVELDKLLAAPAAHRGLAAVDSWGLLASVLPELTALNRCRAGQDRPDVWTHTLDAVKTSCTRRRLPGRSASDTEEARRLLRWALLLHDISKPETLDYREDGRPTFHGHEVLGARRADALLKRLRLPRRERRRVCRLIALHLRPGHLADAGAPTRGLRRLVRDAGEDLALLVQHAACDALASGSADADRRWRRLSAVLGELMRRWRTRPRTPLPTLIDGRDVMRLASVPAGPLVGRILASVRELQEEGTIRNRQQALDEALRLALAASGNRYSSRG